jgi:hypothetical protein
MSEILEVASKGAGCRGSRFSILSRGARRGDFSQ